MSRKWKYQQRLLNSFWNRSRKDYLLYLKSAHKRQTPIPTVLKVGDVVLIDKMQPQTLKMIDGRTEELFLGRDGLTHSCTGTCTMLKSGFVVQVYCVWPFTHKLCAMCCYRLVLENSANDRNGRVHFAFPIHNGYLVNWNVTSLLALNYDFQGKWKAPFKGKQ